MPKSCIPPHHGPNQLLLWSCETSGPPFLPLAPDRCLIHCTGAIEEVEGTACYSWSDTCPISGAEETPRLLLLAWKLNPTGRIWGEEWRPKVFLIHSFQDRASAL